MKAKVWELIGNRAPKDGHVGLELECEFRHRVPPDQRIGKWVAKAEGSLRGNGVEYVTNRPIKCNINKRGHIEALTTLINNPAYGIITDSPRTSLHVHVNVSDLTAVQVWTQVVAFWLVENLLLKYCGDSREGNLFCLRLMDAEALARYVMADLQKEHPFIGLRHDRIRYAAQNLNAICKFGSIEYRCMRGVTDAATIDLWSDELHGLSVNSQQFNDPAEFMDRFFYDNKERFLRRLLSPAFCNLLIRNNPDWEDLIAENAPVLCEIAYSQNWEAWGNNVDNYFYNREEKKKKAWVVEPNWNDDIGDVDMDQFANDVDQPIIVEMAEQPNPGPVRFRDIPNFNWAQAHVNVIIDEGNN